MTFAGMISGNHKSTEKRKLNNELQDGVGENYEAQNSLAALKKKGYILQIKKEY